MTTKLFPAFIITAMFFAGLTIVKPVRAANDGFNFAAGVLGLGAALIINDINKKNKNKNRRKVKQKPKSPAARAEPRLSRDQAKIVQQRLNELGYNVGNPDGSFGRNTRNGIKAYQASIGEKATGYFTRAQLGSFVTLAAPARNGNGGSGYSEKLTRDEVRLFQRSLNVLGYNAGKVDGVMGRGTGRSVKRFLEDRNYDPQTTSQRTALALAAKLAGFDYTAPAANGLGAYSIGQGANSPQNGEVSIFDIAPNSLNSADFEQQGAASAEKSPEIETIFSPFNAQEYDGNDTRGKRDLIAMVIAAKPLILDDQELLSDLYKFEGRTYKSSYRIEETLAAYRNELKERPVPSSTKLMLKYKANIRRGEFSRSLGKFNINYGAFGRFNDTPNRYNQLHLRLLGSENPIHMELETLPDITGIPMILEQAETFEQTMATNKYNFVTSRIFVQINGISYDANRNKLTADTELVAANLGWSYDHNKEVFHSWPIEGARLSELIVEELTGPVDFIDFMGGVRVIQDHLVVERGSNWSRLAASMVLGKYKNLLDLDYNLIALSKTLLLPYEQDLLWGGRAPRDGWQANEFDWKDTAAKIRSSFGTAIAKRGVAGPFKLVQVRPVTLDRYNFNNFAFPLNYYQDSEIGFSQSSNGVASFVGSWGNTFFPNQLKVAEDAARVLDGVMRVKKNRVFYLGVFGEVEEIEELSAAELNRRVKPLFVKPKVTRIALYADPNLTKLVFDYYGKAGSDLQNLQKKMVPVFEAFAIKATSEEAMIMKTYEMVEDDDYILNVVHSTPAYRGANEIQKIKVEKVIKTELSEIVAPDYIWHHGQITLGEYKLNEEYFEISSVSLSHSTETSTGYNAQITHEFVNSLGVLDMPIAEAESLLERFPGRSFQIRMRTTPLSAVWDSGTTSATIAHRPEELYILIDNNRNTGREKSILAYLTFDREDMQLSGGENEPLELERPELSQALLNAITMSEYKGELSQRNIGILLANQWLFDTQNVESLNQKFFQPNDAKPTKANLSLIAAKYVAWRRNNLVKVPKKLKIKLETSLRRLSLGGGITLSINDEIKAAHCHHVTKGYYKKLLNDLGIDGDKTNGQETGPVLMTFLNTSVFDCASRLGESLKANFAENNDDNLPKLQVIIDQLSIPENPKTSSSNLIEVDVKVDKFELVHNGADLPHVRIHVSFEEANYYLFEKGSRTLVNTIKREAIEEERTRLAEEKIKALDVVGVKLGMSFEDADEVIRKHFKKPHILASATIYDNQTAPFNNALMYVRKDKRERINLYFENDGEEKTVLAVERVVMAPNWALPRAAVNKASRRKYGEPALDEASEQSNELIWGENLGKITQDNVLIDSPCGLSRNQTSIENWTDSEGNSHSIYGYFAGEYDDVISLQNVPSLEDYKALDVDSFEGCGVYLKLLHTKNHLTTLLVNLDDYNRAYVRARDVIRNQNGYVNEIGAGDGVEIKL
ncbi:MAG: peptidoglycan-binding protein [Hyphomicrobiales bacterium]